MSWPQWTGSGIPQTGVVPAAVMNSTVINPAPNVVNPNAAAMMAASGQYTPEQWAQMQHQNWQQWAQWQQQFQQWQQQYGAEYQKSMSAMQQAVPQPVQPPLPFFNTNTPPPLPAETKPPPPPDEPQFTNAPPPPQSNYPTAPSSQPPPPTEPFQNQFPPPQINRPPTNQAGFGIRGDPQPPDQAYNQQPPSQNFNQPPPNQGYNQSRPNNQGFNANRPPPQQANNRWGQQSFHENNPPVDSKNRGPMYGNKRPYNQEGCEAGDQKRNKIEPANDSNKWQAGQQKPRWDQVENVRWSTPKPVETPKQNPEELSEAEKKFDKQFSEWESQFKKWKEQNANHPDKEQYSQYEKKWETWRKQLLERREQMKRKRLGLTGDSPQPVEKPSVKQTDNLPDKPEGSVKDNFMPTITSGFSQQPVVPSSNAKPGLLGNAPGEAPPSTTDKHPFNAASQMGRIPSLMSVNVGGIFDKPVLPAMNDLPLTFKKSQSDMESSEMEKGANKTTSFFPSQSFGGIPGLDLVKDEKDDEPKKEEAPEESPMQKGADLEAISRGINSILGDQKLMNMLSLVSQTQNRPPATTTSVINTEPPKILDDYSNQDAPDGADRFSNMDDQTRSSFNINDLGLDAGNYNEGNMEEYSGEDQSRSSNMNWERPGGYTKGPNFNKGPDGFDKMGGPANFDIHGSDNFNRGPDNFDNSGPNNFGRGLGNFDNFHRGGGSGNFNRNLGHSNNAEPDNFNSGPDGFARGPGNFRGPNNFNRGGRNFNTGPDNFNRPSGNFPQGNKGPNNFNRGSDDFNRGPDNFNRGPDNFKQGQDRFNRGPDNFNKGFNKGPDALTNRPDNFRGPDFNRQDNFNKRPGADAEFNRGSGNFNMGPGNVNRGADTFNRGPGNFNNRGPDTFRGNDNFNRGPDNFNRGNFRAPLLNSPSDQFNNRGPPGRFEDDFDDNDDNLEMEAERFNEEPYEEEEEKGNFPIAPGNFPIAPGNFHVDVVGLNKNINEQVAPKQEKEEKIVAVEEIWKPANVIDYEHKSQKPDPDVIVEMLHTFDYRHKPLNRIPYPQRPAWFTDMVKNYPDFDVGGFARPYDQQARRYPVENRYEPRYDDRRFGEDRKAWDRAPPAHEDRDRRFNDDWERNPYDRKSEDKRPKLFDKKSPHDLDKFKRFSDEKETRKEKKNEDAFNKPTAVVAAKSNVTLIEDLLNLPGRLSRPPRLVIIIRGPPGSGKSFLAKLIKDKEVENGGSAPRILCLDDYFMVEQEKEVEEDGKKVKIKDMVYEYEECMEASYRTSLMKSFKKTITDGYFNFIIVDNINEKVKYFGEMWSFAKQNGFQVYICQMELDVQTCTKRNIHNRSESEIEKCVGAWEATPSHHPILDATSLIQAGSIPEVEMEEIDSPPSESMNEEEHLITSKWDSFDNTVDNLAKLDGISKPLRASRTMEDYLQLDDEWVQPVSTKPGQKRVRWADLEERKEQEKMRAIGFVVGHTNWDRMMDPTMGSGALTQTKYIERYS